MSLLTAMSLPQASSSMLPFFNSQELGPEFKLTYSRVEEFTDSTGLPFRTANQTFEDSGDSPTRIRVLYGVYPNERQVEKAWRRINRSNFPGTTSSDDSRWGDIYAEFGDYHYRFLKGNVVAAVTVFYGDTVPQSDQESYFENLKKLSIDRAGSLSTADIPTLAVSFEASEPLPNQIQITLKSPSRKSYWADVVVDYSVFKDPASLPPLLRLKEPIRFKQGVLTLRPNLSSLVSGAYTLRVSLTDRLGRKRSFSKDFRIDRRANK